MHVKNGLVDIESTLSHRLGAFVSKIKILLTLVLDAAEFEIRAISGITCREA
jgi:hypothetical protein